MDHITTKCLAAWRDDTHAFVVNDSQEGRELVQALTAEGGIKKLNLILHAAKAVYQLLGPSMNFDRAGVVRYAIFDRLETFSEPIPSLPARDFVVFATREFSDAHPDISEVSPEQAVAIEAALIVNGASREEDESA